MRFWGLGIRMCHYALLMAKKPLKNVKLRHWLITNAPFRWPVKNYLFFCLKIWTIKKPALYLCHSAADVGGVLKHKQKWKRNYNLKSGSTTATGGGKLSTLPTKQTPTRTHL